jgi:hypothetical protein
MSGPEAEEAPSSLLGGVEACPLHHCQTSPLIPNSASESRRVSECVGPGTLGDDPASLLQPGSNVTR